MHSKLLKYSNVPILFLVDRRQSEISEKYEVFPKSDHDSTTKLEILLDRNPTFLEPLLELKISKALLFEIKYHPKNKSANKVVELEVGVGGVK